MYKKSKKILILILVLVLVTESMLFTSCSKKNSSNNKTIKIAEQYGLAYAPIQIMKANKILENKLPEITVEWSQLANTAAIRESMLANKLDIGFMAIPPFLIGWDKGMSWKIATGLSSSPLGLVTNKSNINLLSDIQPSDKIALPQPGSIQHILLSMASERQLGDSHKFDNQLVTMSHPDGMSALLSNTDITAHFTSPPYIFKELENPDLHSVISGKEAFGKDFTFIVGVTTEDFHNKNADLYNTFIESLNEAISYIENNREDAVKILSPIYNIPEKELLKYLSWEGNEYNSEVKGIDEFADFMLKNNYISKKFQSNSDILWDNVKYEK
ncbi:ABC transporter substrate-binding protein [Clostridium sediminicola]|uniref:ABC transporter substrate-binding protein n=1 Tax=Clostridium sediminicola TaxID=3114879 RepID=UPI0031F1C879